MSTLKDHVLSNMKTHIDQINSFLLEWSIMCQPIIRSKDTDKVFLDLVTEHLVTKLIPLLGIELERPWASLALIQEQVKENLQSQSVIELAEANEQLRENKRIIADQRLVIQSLTKDIKSRSRWIFFR